MEKEIRFGPRVASALTLCTYESYDPFGP
jgi:hypothetical protein